MKNNIIINEIFEIFFLNLLKILKFMNIHEYKKKIKNSKKKKS
jgi:hypothetical protein